MADLIDRGTTYNVLTEYYNHQTDIQHQVLREALSKVPSAQPEIIRCKDCKYCRKVDESEYWCYGFCSPARLVRKDDFCSYGCKYE